MKFGVHHRREGRRAGAEPEQLFVVPRASATRDLRRRAVQAVLRGVRRSQIHRSPRRSRIRSRPMSSTRAPAITPAPAKPRSFTTTCRSRVYDNLIATVRANLAPLFRYYECANGCSGCSEIHQYDTYVPIVAEHRDRHARGTKRSTKSSPRSRRSATNTCATLGDGLRGRWCDRYENKGKRSGAFSSSSYGNPPFILMNYKDDVFADVYTLAHEAGHSMHTWYAQRTQRYQDLRLPDLPRGSREHLQRRAAHASSARGDQRPADARLSHQPADR